MTALATLPPLEHDPARVRELADRALARDEFAATEPGPVARLFDRVLEAIARLFADVVAGTTGTAVLAWVVVGLGTVLLAVVIWRLTVTSSIDRRQAAVPTAQVGRSAAAWRRDADEAEAAGRYSDALRLRYRAAVTVLVEAGVLDDVPGRTVRELDAVVAEAAPTVAPSLAAAGRAFEDVWYGHQAVADDHRAAVSTADEDAQAVAGGRRRSAPVASS